MKLVITTKDGKSHNIWGINAFEWGVHTKSSLFVYTDEKVYVIRDVKRIESASITSLGMEFTSVDTLRIMH